MKHQVTHDPKTEAFVRANGTVYERKNIEVMRLDLDTEHFYYLGKIGWVPSVTSVLDEAAPVAYGLRQFWKNNTAEESETIFRKAGDFGSKLHGAFEQLLLGEELNLLTDYRDIREKKAIMTFADWFNIIRPVDFMSEQVVASTKYLYAGTLDFLGRCRRSNMADALQLPATKRKEFLGSQPNRLEWWLIDFKTTRVTSYNHELQVAAYRQAVWESLGIRVAHMGLLRLPTQHKAGYEFKEVHWTINDYLHIYRTYMNLHNGKIPAPEELVSYPNTFKLLNEIREEVKNERLL